MPGYLSAAARTPWVPRGGKFAEVHPEELLTAAVVGVLDAAGLRPADVALLLVACDSPVGAQAGNIARRVARRMGADALPALTVDGQHAGGLALVHLARGLTGPVVVGAVDSTSIVSPGATMVRDYGRPETVEPADPGWLDALCRAHGVTRGALDRSVLGLTKASPVDAVGIVAVPHRRSLIATDDRPDAVDANGLVALDPLTGATGVVTSAHQASLADGAAAVVLADTGRAITDSMFAAMGVDAVVDALARAVASASTAVLVSDAAVPVLHVVGALDAWPSAIGSVPVVGSAPSADGLRLLVDAVHRVPGSCTVLARGRGGLLARVDLGPDDHVR